jgi:AcrR family transcriptional regulator
MTSTTKDKILDTAERLFAERGFDAISLRHIIAEADVNLAAIHYHFGSKEGLLDAIVLRKMTLVNAQRIGLLDRYEAESGQIAAPIDKVLEAFMAPTFAMAYAHPLFLKLMARLHAEGVMMRLMKQHFQSVLDRFLAAYLRAVPDLPPEDLHLRLHFTIGAMARALFCGPEMLPAGARYLSAEEVSQRLVAFATAGFRAPVPARQEK